MICDSAIVALSFEAINGAGVNLDVLLPHLNT